MEGRTRHATRVPGPRRSLRAGQRRVASRDDEVEHARVVTGDERAEPDGYLVDPLGRDEEVLGVQACRVLAVSLQVVREEQLCGEDRPVRRLDLDVDV